MSFGGLQSYVYRLTLTSGPYVDRVYPLADAAETTPLKFDGFRARRPAEIALPVEIALAGAPGRKV